jgi:hypothetical protein
VRITEKACDLALAFDADNDGDLDVLVLEGTRLTLFEQKDARFSAVPIAFPALPSAPRAIVATDYDHEGDLDVLGAFYRLGLRSTAPRPASTPSQIPKSPEQGGRSPAFTASPRVAATPSEPARHPGDITWPTGPGHFEARRGVARTSPFQPFVADLDGERGRTCGSRRAEHVRAAVRQRARIVRRVDRRRAARAAD